MNRSQEYLGYTGELVGQPYTTELYPPVKTVQSHGQVNDFYLKRAKKAAKRVM